MIKIYTWDEMIDDLHKGMAALEGLDHYAFEHHDMPFMPVSYARTYLKEHNLMFEEDGTVWEYADE